MPGFLRVEPEPGVQGVGGEWFEWEIILSRFVSVCLFVCVCSARVCCCIFQNNIMISRGAACLRYTKYLGAIADARGGGGEFRLTRLSLLVCCDVHRH